jgi:hypothetical protein
MLGFSSDYDAGQMSCIDLAQWRECFTLLGFTDIEQGYLARCKVRQAGTNEVVLKCCPA